MTTASAHQYQIVPQQNGRNSSNQRRAWRTWQDWAALAAGIYLALSPIWVPNAPVGWFVTFGVLVSAVALMGAGSASCKGAEWTQAIIGAVIFLSPWFGAFPETYEAVAWTSWIVGSVIFLLAASTYIGRED